MTEIEPTIENVRVGDVITIESGTPGEAGHTLSVHRVDGGPISTGGIALVAVRARARGGYYRITRIDRPSPPIPSEQGERFWARWRSGSPREYMVTDEQAIVSLGSGAQWDRDLFESNCTVVPAPEPKPETVPVPADLIREAGKWNDSLMRSNDVGAGILRSIVRAVREREGES